MTWQRCAQRINRHRAPPDGAYLRRIAGICWVGLILVGQAGARPWRYRAKRMTLCPCRHGVLGLPVICGSVRSRFCTGCAKPIRALRRLIRRCSMSKTSWGHSQPARGNGCCASVAADAPDPNGPGISRQDLTVMAYAPTQPPRPIRTARFNARTRKMTYIPAVPSKPS